MKWLLAVAMLSAFLGGCAVGVYPDGDRHYYGGDGYRDNHYGGFHEHGS